MEERTVGVFIQRRVDWETSEANSKGGDRKGAVEKLKQVVEW